jgi:hypothetical protein
MSERNDFGPCLKAERDRRGITLQAISDSTKISLSLLAALERNDMSRWPNGIFRRAFVREYVAALGLPPEPLVAEFVRLFPESSSSGVLESPCSGALEVTELRMTFDTEPSAPWPMIRTRAFVACLEVFAVTAMGLMLAWVLGAEAWKAIGMAALFYYPLASVFLERSPKPRLLYRPAGPTRWLHSTSRSLRGAWPKPTVRIPEAEELDGSATAAPEWHTASN